ncbi:MAG: ABC transporter ATP-binding protein [Actinomycetota bacterium]
MNGLDARVQTVRGSLTIDVELAVEPGRTVALLGPNGAGKSTVVAALAGLLPLKAGWIRLDGTTLEDPAIGASASPSQRPIGTVFQDLLLFPHLSALDNVAFPLRARGIARTQARARAGELLEHMGIAHRARAKPWQLSGGEAQRVALARAVVHKPRLLLLDEPLSALDVRARGEILHLVRSTLASFEGVRVVVTHDPLEAMTLADELVLIEDGRVTQRGTPEDIRRAPTTSYAAELVGVNLFRGRLVPADAGVGRLDTADGILFVALPEPETLDDVLALVRPTDVSLFRARPEGSARNVLEGPIESITVSADRARVRIGSHPGVVAEITPGSVTRLGLTEGVHVWASFKAVEVTLVAAGSSD